MNFDGINIGDFMYFDTECYTNFWCVMFLHDKTNKVFRFVKSPEEDFDPLQLAEFLYKFTIVGFNSTNYDIPMIELALKGLSCQELKQASDYIIQSGINYGTEKVTAYDVARKYGFKIPNYNHIDIFNVCPVNGGNGERPASLKTYAARLHAKELQDLPFDPDKILTKDDSEVLMNYCVKDLKNTKLVFESLQEFIKIRYDMSKQYNVDLRSKSDAQIAEAVVVSRLEQQLNRKIYKPDLPENYSIKFSIPECLQFKTAYMQNVLKIVQETSFYLDGKGSPILPKSIKDLNICINNKNYNLQIGGLHSQEHKVSYVAKNGMILADNDVASYYPSLILTQFLAPKHLGQAFLKVYDDIVKERLTAKANKNKTVADTLKIVINGSFGKFGNQFSAFYSPDLMLQVTLSGQLYLLMLIESLELEGVNVVSANTDGIVLYYHESEHEKVRNIISLWESRCGLQTEETRYKALYSRDVNNYIAVKFKGDENGKYEDERLGLKTKGAYCERGSALNSVLSKNPEFLIVLDAVYNFIVNSTPLMQTILNCKDVTRFVAIKNVAGGGKKGSVYLGKVVRFYYAKNEIGCITYVKNNNKVSKTDGAKPLMDLPENLPEDIDYNKYLQIAIETLEDLNVMSKFEQADLI